ncbi:MAG: hypothetical protein NUV32_05360 [Exilispira sp.]|jgi:hypothetical protein|nr:hypothetical protein [Exilispira sp.]
MPNSSYNIFRILLLLFFIFSLSHPILAQNLQSFKVFIIKGTVNYIIPNFNQPFDLVDNSIIPSNCKIVTSKNGYLEIHSKTSLIRILPSTTLEIQNDKIILISGTIYINTLDNIYIISGKDNLLIYRGTVIIQFSKETIINFISDAQLEINSTSFQPTKNDRIFTINNGNIIKSKEKLPINKFDQFSKEIKTKVENINSLIDIFFERIFYLIEKNNSFIERINYSEKRAYEIENKVKEQLQKFDEKNSDILNLLNNYGEIFQLIEGEILDYKFIRYHYLEFYFQMRNYFEYYKRLIEYANDVYELNQFDEFPDYSSKSSFMILYNKIKSFTETIKLSYEVLEITYINILDSNSVINKSYNKFEIIKSNMLSKLNDIFINYDNQLPKDLITLISQTFLIQLESKVSTTIYINRLYDILLLLNNEFVEDEKIINKFFSLDDIVYKSLYLKQADDIKADLINNFSNLNKNLTILKYLLSNSKLIKNENTNKLLSTIIQFYPDYEEDYLSMLSIIDEIGKAYNKYMQLLKLFLKKEDSSLYYNIFSKEIEKYISYLNFIQSEIFKYKDSENLDITYIKSLINIQDNIIFVTNLLYETLKNKYPQIQFPKKLFIDQQKEYNIKLKNEIENLSYQENTEKKNQEIKKFLIIRIILINQILEDIEIFKQSIKDYEYQKSNVIKSLQLYNIAITNKSSFDAQNYSQNSSLIWETNQLLFSLDNFIIQLNNFEVQLKDFFDNIQIFYLLENYSDENLKEIEDNITKIQNLYNIFTLYYFNLIEKIYQFNTNILMLQSKDDNLLTNDIIKDLNTFIFLYKSKIDSFRSILSIIRVVFNN